MRQARIKVPAAEQEAVYHCVTRTVNKERLFDRVAKEVLRRQLWQVADYCGVQILTYTILSNHFHVVVRVPQERPVSDAELLRRYQVLYPKPSRYQAMRLKDVQAQLAENGPEAALWRQRQLRLMGDISPFMKLVKQRFSIWFNKAHCRIGTLWAERFKSILLGPGALQPVVVYTDLNCVRAGLAPDPKDYRFCGYAEAVAGNRIAQEALRQLLGGREWADTQTMYRELLFGAGGSPRAAAANIPMREVQRVLVEGGQLPLATVLRCRVRYFTDGAVLGSRAFVEEQLAIYRRKTGRRQGMVPHPLQPCTNWGDLTTLRSLRQDAIG